MTQSSPTDRSLVRRPMATARKVSLFRREIREWISPHAFEILLGAADLVTEGSFDGGEGDPVFFGSVEVRIALGRCKGYIDGPLDASAARRLTSLMDHDELVTRLLRDLARREAERVAGCALFDLQVEPQSTHRGEELRILLDVEGRVRPRSIQPAGGVGGP